MPTQPPDRARDVDSRGAATGSRGPLIHVSTRCGSIDEFVEKFSGFASYGALVLPAAGELPAGTEGRFVIRLADQTVAMRGRCRVTDVKTVPVSPTATGPRRTLLRVALLEMEEGSRNVHARLLAHRRDSVPLPVAPSESEPTIVSPNSPVPPPPLRPPPPPPVAALARTMTMIGVAPGTAPLASKAAAPPPVAAVARTMIGVAPGAGPSAGRAAVAPPPAERRVPGAAFTLPANPLSPLDADDLASFIDSTLFETDDDDATAERVARPPEIEVPIEEVAVEQAAPTTVVGAVERTSPVTGRGPSPTRRRAVRLAPYALCLVLGLLIGRAWLAPAPSSIPASTPVAVAGGTAVAAAEAPAAVRAPPAPPHPADVEAHTAAAETRPASAPIVEPAQAAATPVVEPSTPRTSAPGDCSARIVTEPADAKIVWGGKVLGQSPIEAARIPCGAGTVLIEHERYQPVVREVTAAPGAAVVVSQRLRRPSGTLIVNSSPPRAYVTVNDQMLGAAPRRLAASRFEQVSLRATFPGYLPWTKKIYLKEPTTTITAQLVPTGRGGGDAAKHPPAAR